MEYGKVDPRLINHTDFSLPPDPELTNWVLSQSQPVESLKVYAGCSSWGQKVWKGSLFPANIKETDFLTEYTKHFDCVELNATFYRIFDRETITNWYNKTAGNKEFKFCPKINQLISHTNRLIQVDELTSKFLNSVAAFGDKLGPVFLQLNDSFSPRNIDLLKNFLNSFPSHLNLFIELRHPDWFTQDLYFEAIQHANVGTIITDTAGRRDAVHMTLTVPHAFIRFVGNGLHPTDYVRVDEWVVRIARWAKQGLQSLYFIMHQPDEVKAPVLCDYFVKRINEVLDLKVKRPGLLPTSGTLF